ncbi:uncharacterized protein LOC129588669 [Paramacrobiotus metropolitanus]|uniref:uncharacterized protein LOC129588669 n=1 Tax=Paramacrobiotus metropolitanus TaxID=2943436 RepID=UPI002445B0EF|nr:uncharacterized protein LOC129588669 [Paramacrobiotus metropolitanus]
MSALPFPVGQIVWAKIKGYNRWPACVETPPENARNRGVYVQFFGTDKPGQFGWVPKGGLEPFTVGDQSMRELSNTQLQACVKLAALKKNGNTVAPPVVPPTPQCVVDTVQVQGETQAQSVLASELNQTPAFMNVSATDSLSIATISPAAEVSTPDLSHNYSFRGDEVSAISEQDVISEVSGSTTGRNKGIIPLDEVDSWISDNFLPSETAQLKSDLIWQFFERFCASKNYVPMPNFQKSLGRRLSNRFNVSGGFNCGNKSAKGQKRSGIKLSEKGTAAFESLTGHNVKKIIVRY